MQIRSFFLSSSTFAVSWSVKIHHFRQLWSPFQAIVVFLWWTFFLFYLTIIIAADLKASFWLISWFLHAHFFRIFFVSVIIVSWRWFGAILIFCWMYVSIDFFPVTTSVAWMYWIDIFLVVAVFRRLVIGYSWEMRHFYKSVVQNSVRRTTFVWELMCKRSGLKSLLVLALRFYWIFAY